jgi:glycosyltransferase involved in cell wall biosynthesis
MHILFISSWFPSEKFPFNGNFVIRHAEAVAQLHRVTFLNVTSNPLNDKRALAIKDSVDLIEIVFKPCRVPVIGKIVNRLLIIVLYIKAIPSILRSDNPFDVLHVNVAFPIGIVALWVKWRYKKPFIVTEHWTGYLDKRPTKLSFFHRWLTKLICRHASFVCPVSENLARSMQKLGFQGQYQVVSNVVDTELFANVVHHQNSKPQLVHISSVDDHQKNIKGILRVISQLKQQYLFDFHIISDNSVDWIRQYLQQQQMPADLVMFHGPFTPSQIADFLGHCDLMVLFSRYENLPCVIAESLVAGTPVISSNVGGIHEMINDTNGRLVESEDGSALFRHLSLFFNNDLAFNWLEIQKHAIGVYSYDSVAQRLTSIYQSARC